MSQSQPPPGLIPKKSPVGLYIALIAVLLALIGGLIWYKVARKPQPVTPQPVVQSVVPTAAPPPVFDIPAPPELDASADADTGAGKRPSGGVNLCAGPCQGDAPPALQSALTATASASRGCYERALRNNAALQGRMVVSVRIAANGTVCGASISQDALGAQDVSSCVLGLFRGKTYPPPTGGRCVDVNVPLSFQPRETK